MLLHKMYAGKTHRVFKGKTGAVALFVTNPQAIYQEMQRLSSITQELDKLRARDDITGETANTALAAQQENDKHRSHQGRVHGDAKDVVISI